MATNKIAPAASQLARTQRKAGSEDPSAPSTLGIRVADFVASWEASEDQEVSHEQEVYRSPVGCSASYLSGGHQETQGIVAAGSACAPSPESRCRWTSMDRPPDCRGFWLPRTND